MMMDYNKDNPELRGLLPGKTSSESYTRTPSMFFFLFVVAQLFGLGSVIGVALWMNYYGSGYQWPSASAGKVFSYHPLFAITGIVYLNGTGILVYRVFRDVKKLYTKLLHAGIQGSALAVSGVGVRAAFKFHGMIAAPNMFSLHSWLAVITISLFSLQWLFGFISFLYPRASPAARSTYKNYHVFWGVAILCSGCATAVMGLLQKGNQLQNYSDLPPEALLLNFIGLGLVNFVCITIYLVSRPEYRRMPRPEDEHVQYQE